MEIRFGTKWILCLLTLSLCTTGLAEPDNLTETFTIRCNRECNTSNDLQNVSSIFFTYNLIFILLFC